MLPEPASPTATPAAALKPPPLTPYRGSAPPVSASGQGGPSGQSQGVVGMGGGFRGPSPPLWDQALEQEKRLRSELRKKSFWDPDVRRLRSALQGTYEALLFSHFDFSCANEVEPCLWKAVFYKPIEEFRSRVRALEALAKGAAAAVQGAAGGAAAVQLASPEEARQQLARTTSAYLRFLDDALAFYRKTVWKLQWVYGNVGATVDLDAALQNEIQECVPRATGARVPDARPSVHRCLIYLGDLCRYQSMALKERPTSARPLWERAMSYYRQAARVLPASGNPYNQMAVMSYYTNDELRAVYYYFRSLAVAMPFVTARENLLLLFEKNRSKYGNIAAAHASAALRGGREPDSRAAAGLLTDVATRFVRLHGLLFDRINLDTLPEVLEVASRDLEAMLGNTGCRALLQKASESDQILFHLAIMSVFAVHNVSTPPPAGVAAGGYAAAVQRATDRCHALAVALRFAAAVAACTASMAETAAAAGGVGEVDMGFGAVSASCHVMLAWMVSNPHMLTAEPTAATAPAASAAAASVGMGCETPEVAAEVAARSAFLTAAARLAAHLSDLTRRRAQDQDWQDPAVRHRSLPEDSELVGFGPLAPVVSIASSWPAASEAPGGAALLAVRVARMLQALRHIDDALVPPRNAPPRQTAGPSTAAHELVRAVQSFKAAMAQAITSPSHHVLYGGAAPPPGSLNGHATSATHAGFGLATVAPHHDGSHHPHKPQHLVPPPPNGQAQPHALSPVDSVPVCPQHPQHPQHAHAGQPNALTQRHAPQHWQEQQPPPAMGNGLGATGPAGGAAPEGSSLARQPPRSPVAQQLLGVPGRGLGGLPASEGHRRSGSGAGGSGSGDLGQRGNGAPPPSPFVPPGYGPGGQHSPPLPPPLPRMLNSAAGPIRTGVVVVAAATATDTRADGESAAGLGAAGDSHPRTAVGAPAAAAVVITPSAVITSARAGAAGAARKGGAGVTEGDAEDAAEDEIVYQPPKQGSAMARPASISSGLQHLHRRSSSGGVVPQDQRGTLSKQPSAGGSSAAHLHSREPSRDGSSLLLRSPSALSTGGDLNASGGAPMVGAGPALGLTVACTGGSVGGRLSGSGLASPASAYGNTVPPSPHNLIWETFSSVHNSGGAGGGSVGGSGTGMLPPPAPMAPPPSGSVAAAMPGAAGHPARPPSPAVGDLPGAGTIGLLQNLLHAGAPAGGGGGINFVTGAASSPPTARGGQGSGSGLLPGGRRLSSGAGMGAAAAVCVNATAAGAGLGGMGAIATAAGAVTATSTSTSAGVISMFAGAAGTGSRPGSSGANGASAGTSPGVGSQTGVMSCRPPVVAGSRAPTSGQGSVRTAGLGPGFGMGSGSSIQVLQLDQPTGQPPQLLIGQDALTAPFAGLPASLQQRGRPGAETTAAASAGGPHPQALPPQPLQPSQPRVGSAQLLLTMGSHLGQQGVTAIGLTPQALLPYGGGGGSATSTFGLPLPLSAPHLPGEAGSLAAGARPGADGMGTPSAAAGGTGLGASGHYHMAWPSGAAAAAAATGTTTLGGLDMYFAAAAGNYQAAALAEATAEATAVAMADDVLQAMDADDDDAGSFFATAIGGHRNPSAFAGDAAGGGGGLYGSITEDLMDIERFSPAAAAAAGGGGSLGPGPATREPSAASDGLFSSGGCAGGSGIVNAGGAASGGFSGLSSGSGQGLAAVLAAAGVTGLVRSGEGAAEGGTRGAAGPAGTTGSGLAAAALGNVEGFGSWGVVQVLPEQLTEYNQRLRRDVHAGGGGGGGGGACGSSAGGATAINGNRAEALVAATVALPPLPPQPRILQPPRPQQQHLQAWAGQLPHARVEYGPGSAATSGLGGRGAAGVFGEDLSCLAFLTAQLHAPDTAAAGAGSVVGAAADGMRVASHKAATVATAAAADAQG